MANRGKRGKGGRPERGITNGHPLVRSPGKNRLGVFFFSQRELRVRVVRRHPLRVPRPNGFPSSCVGVRGRTLYGTGHSGFCRFVGGVGTNV